MAQQLHVERRGDGPVPVVFVHGVLDRGRSFDRVAAELASECSMRWYDRRGYGAAVDAEGAPVEVDRHADDLLAVLDGAPATVVGHSFGGMTVVTAALRAPELFDALVLYETGMPWAPGWDDRPVLAVLEADDPEEAAIRMMFGSRWDAMDEGRRARLCIEARAFLAEEGCVRHGRPTPDLSALEVPLVYGHSDTWQPAVPRHVSDAVPASEVVELPGAGHNAHRSQPGPFADLVRRGLALARSRRSAAGPVPSSGGSRP